MSIKLVYIQKETFIQKGAEKFLAQPISKNLTK